MRRTEELTQELLEWKLKEMLCLEERRLWLGSEIGKLPKHMGHPLVSTLEEALRAHAWEAERKAVEEDQRALAGEMMSMGVPPSVWYRCHTLEGKEAKVKLYTSNDQPYFKAEISK